MNRGPKLGEHFGMFGGDALGDVGPFYLAHDWLPRSYPTFPELRSMSARWGNTCLRQDDTQTAKRKHTQNIGKRTSTRGNFPDDTVEFPGVESGFPSIC
jgi:hypothetical protein